MYNAVPASAAFGNSPCFQPVIFWASARLGRLAAAFATCICLFVERDAACLTASAAAQGFAENPEWGDVLPLPCRLKNCPVAFAKIPICLLSGSLARNLLLVPLWDVLDRGGAFDDDNHCRCAGCTKAALYIAVRSGPCRTAARDRARDGRSRICRQPEDFQRRLLEADFDDRRADRVLRRRARHRRRRRPQEGRAGRRQGAGLFRGDDDGGAGGRPVARLFVRPRPRHERRSIDARCQGAQHLCRQRPQAEGRRDRQLPAEHHPDHLVRRAVAQRRAAGAVLRDPVRHQPCPGRRRKGREDHLADRRRIDRAVPDDGPDRARGAARRARRGRLYGREVRRRLAQATGLAGRPVLRLGRDLRPRRARRRDGARRAEHSQVPGLSARGTDDRAGHRVVGRGAAADHAQARAAWASATRWSAS